jgi:hypothetical protein
VSVTHARPNTELALKFLTSGARFIWTRPGSQARFAFTGPSHL